MSIIRVRNAVKRFGPIVAVAGLDLDVTNGTSNSISVLLNNQKGSFSGPFDSITHRGPRHITSRDVIEQLYELFLLRGVPEHIRSDNGPEFTAKSVRRWLNRVGVKTLFIEPGSPWENGYIESFNSKLRDELLNGEVFTTLTEAKILIEQWRGEYNHFRPHSALGYRPPVPEAKLSLTLT